VGGRACQPALGGRQHWAGPVSVLEDANGELRRRRENLTAGSLRATTHRVLIPRRPRISVPYFYSPPLLSALKPLTFDELHPDLQEQIRERDEEVSEVPRGDLHFPRFGEGAWKGIIRSHVAVYDKWYGSSKSVFFASFFCVRVSDPLAVYKTERRAV
jgi:hypothetical protein